MELQELIAEITLRLNSRAIECRDSDDHDKILRAQGAARELSELLAFVDQKENPQKEEKDL